MVLQVKRVLEIENLHHYPAEAVAELRRILKCGAEARPDPRREAFFELQNGAKVFYIHVSPSNGKVYLLAIWDKDRPVEYQRKIAKRNNAA